MPALHFDLCTTVIARLTDGEVIGESPFLLGRAPAADVVCESEEVSIIRLPKAYMTSILETSATVAVKFYYILALRAADKLLRMARWKGTVSAEITQFAKSGKKGPRGNSELDSIPTPQSILALGRRLNL